MWLLAITKDLLEEIELGFTTSVGKLIRRTCKPVEKILDGTV